MRKPGWSATHFPVLKTLSLYLGETEGRGSGGADSSLSRQPGYPRTHTAVANVAAQQTGRALTSHTPDRHNIPYTASFCLSVKLKK